MDKLQYITNLIEESQREAVREGRVSYVESYRLAKIITDLLATKPVVRVEMQDIKGANQ